MRSLLLLFCLSTIPLSYAQDRDTVRSAVEEKEKLFMVKPVLTPNQSGNLPEVDYIRIKQSDIKQGIYGSFSVEKSLVQIKSKSSSELSKAIVGTNILISRSALSGEKIESLDIVVTDTEMMDTEDYIFRNFGIVHDEPIEGLPKHVMVHKTNNVACYGIAELPDGTILVPHEGLLIYLKRLRK